MIETLLFLPIALAILVLIVRNKALNIIVTTVYAAVFMGITVMLYLKPASFTPYFRIDDLNILFLLVLAAVYFGVAIFNIDFLRKNEAPAKSQALFTANLLVFIASMTGVILSTHLALLWVFVEATTLSSSYLIFFSRSEASLEATWKYLFICSIGIAIAFVGIIFLSMGLTNSDSLFFDDLYKGAKEINPFWLKIAFPFMLAGFGTKVGFAPMHAWLPDAHSESPSPVSALLSGTLLNAALLGIMRVNKIMTLAGMKWYAENLLLVIGFTSIFISAVYIISIKNYKRMLAYSSIENMGIIAICLGVGGAGLFAAMLHLAAHSLTKAAFFLTSGNILHRFKSKHINSVRGLLKTDPLTGWLWMLCFAGIVGIPPFPIFLSEFLVAKTMIDIGMIAQLVLFLLLLTINMAGIGKAVLRMSFGEGDTNMASHRTGILSYLPQMAFIALLLAMGVTLPPFVQTLFQKAAALL
ncbi:MAG TPA: proton-conducting transporter membrane subunit [Spirochaetota bacterium]|nr:hydrogenase [Spirochaetota bacterium]HOD13198.1 proton-conducting transporter membrane subunit [Spirochaetota bacterium]HPG48995.1 proton-conducting transporter membrane subunit [Spirochaetota bacterium]HPN12668.1 proton-conducting transporter membrane subunit [Spirochaetota bacterium]